MIVCLSLTCQLPNASAAPVDDTYGTRVHFVNNPAEAARQAAQRQKLLFLLHVSGNFEESRFT
jgi:hypothetical protein